MKRVLFIFLTFCITQQYLSGQWKRVEIDQIDTIYNLKLYDISFVDPNYGIVVGGFDAVHQSWGKIFVTRDQGDTWRETTTLDYLCPFVSEILLTGNAFILGGYVSFIDKPQLQRSSNFGKTWELDTILTECNALFFLNDTLGWAAGRDHKSQLGLFQTSNSGESWNLWSRVIGCSISSLFFIDEFTGWGVSWGGKIIKFNQGAGELIPQDTLPPLRIVYFTDSLNGWIAGGYHNKDGFKHILLKTTDGGLNWDKVSGMKYLVHDLIFFNSNTGWAVGEDVRWKGIILETKDGGANWNIMENNLSSPLRALEFKDGVGWAAGGKDLILKNENSDYALNSLPGQPKRKKEISLDCFPNPFREKTVIGYRLPVSSKVKIKIYDFTGRIVTSLITEMQQAGSHEVEWNASGFKPGIYFCELRTKHSRLVQKMVCIK